MTEADGWDWDEGVMKREKEAEEDLKRERESKVVVSGGTVSMHYGDSIQ